MRDGGDISCTAVARQGVRFSCLDFVIYTEPLGTKIGRSVFFPASVTVIARDARGNIRPTLLRG